MTESVIYHVCLAADWRQAESAGSYTGSPDDRRDGFIHFSTRGQVRTSTAIHRAAQDGLVLLTVDAAALGQAVKWEPSRGGQLFPHLYGPLPVSAVTEAVAIPLGADGVHQFPPGFPVSDTDSQQN